MQIHFHKEVVLGGCNHLVIEFGKLAAIFLHARAPHSCLSWYADDVVDQRTFGFGLGITIYNRPVGSSSPNWPLNSSLRRIKAFSVLA
jgi:hypothetical protein